MVKKSVVNYSFLFYTFLISILIRISIFNMYILLFNYKLIVIIDNLSIFLILFCFGYLKTISLMNFKNLINVNHRLSRGMADGLYESTAYGQERN